MDSQGLSEEPPYDLRERTLRFAALVVGFVRELPSDVASRELGKQLFRSASSIGANVAEADASESKKDFVHKMSIARKEASETVYWLRLAMTTDMDGDSAESLLDEATQLVRILSTIVNKSRASLKD
jgi:four helix bundle protein